VAIRRCSILIKEHNPPDSPFRKGGGGGFEIAANLDFGTNNDV